MDRQSDAFDRVVARLPGSFRHLAVATVGTVYLTILLGVATKAAGAGLACEARWPLCDGGVLNLFPATVPSFFEWIHRVVAGVAGPLILATAVAAYRGGTSTLVRRAATLAVVLLPFQVLLGRETVLQYTLPILTAHYWTAMAIFGSVVVVAVEAWRSAITAAHVRRATAAALLLVPVQQLFGAQVLSRYSPPIQTAHYAVTLAILAALVLAVCVGWRTADRPVRHLLAAALAILPVQLLLGRQAIMGFAPALGLAHAASAVALFVVLAAATASLYRTTGPATPAPGPNG